MSTRRKAMVVFVDGTTLHHQDLPRSERQRLRLEASGRKREELLTCLQDAGLADEADVPEASPSLSLLIEATPRALDAVSKAPVVDKVLPIADDAPMGLIE